LTGKINDIEQTKESGAPQYQESGEGGEKKRTVAHLPKRTRTALGKEGAKAAKKKKR
jgi:hypothetical protein